MPGKRNPLDEVDVSSLFDESGSAPGNQKMSSVDEIRFERLMDDAAEAMLSKNYADAVKSYERAAELSPRDPIIAGNLARLREIMG